MLPTPGSLCSLISPPRSRVSSRQIDRPRPVPPYLRLVEPSACANDSKIDCCFSKGMQMPVSTTRNATTFEARLRFSFEGLQPPMAISAMNSTLPFSVNLKALLSRLFRICCRR